MIPPNANSEREQIEQSIALQERMRDQADDDLIDATIATLKEKLDAGDKWRENPNCLSPPLQPRPLYQPG